MNAQAAAARARQTPATRTRSGSTTPDNYSSAADLVELAEPAARSGSSRGVADTHGARLRSGDRPRQHRHPQHAAQPRPDGRRGQDRAHARRRAMCWSARRRATATSLISAVLGAPSEARRDAETAEAPRLRVLAVQAARLRSTAARSSPTRSSTTATSTWRWSPQRRVEVSAREGQPVETRVTRPTRSSGADRGGGAAGSRRRSPSTAARRQLAAGRRGVGRGRDHCRQGLSDGQESADPDCRGVAVRDSSRRAAGAREPGGPEPEATARAPSPAQAAEAAEARRRDGARGEDPGGETPDARGEDAQAAQSGRRGSAPG